MTGKTRNKKPAIIWRVFLKEIGIAYMPDFRPLLTVGVLTLMAMPFLAAHLVTASRAAALGALSNALAKLLWVGQTIASRSAHRYAKVA